MSALTRKERERAEHRRLVLEAAEVVFAQKGYHAAAVQEIAERAEFSVGSIYNLFGSKAEIYVELIDMRVVEFLTDVEERLRRQEDVLGKVREAIAAKVEFFKQHQRFFLLFSPFRPKDAEGGVMALPEKPRLRYQDYLGRLSGIFAQGIQEGLFADVGPEVLMLCMEGMTNAVIACRIAGGDAEEAAAPDVLLQVFLRGVLAEGKR